MTEADNRMRPRSEPRALARRAAGNAAAALVESGMAIGLGTGDTAAYAIVALGERVRSGALRGLRCVATSRRSAALAREQGLVLLDLDELQGAGSAPAALDLTIDGADEIDPHLRLIKGAGGALLYEKLVATASRRLIVVADRSKLVVRLGEQRLLPVEVVPFGARHTLARLRAQAGVSDAALRPAAAADGPFITDGGHYIVDVRVTAGADAVALHDRLKALPGVVETGLFSHQAQLAFIGDGDGSVEVRERPASAANS